MTTRGQVLRSSTTGNLPAAGTRQPGEVWTNFPDLQLGVIDAARNAQRLVAVRYFSATANYATGDFVVQAGVLYVAKGAVTSGAFNSTQWTKIAAATDADGPYLPIAGGTLTGALTLNADPGAALGAATKQYVDGKVTAAPFLPLAGGTLTGLVTLSGPPTVPLHAATKAYVDAGAFVPVAGGANTGLNDNRLINGDMRIDQRNNGASGTAAAYTVDRWKYGATQTAKMTWGQNLNAVTGPLGSPNYLGFQSSSAYTPLAGDLFEIFQTIEADMMSDFGWGTASAQPVTLSFWARSSLTGTFSGNICNAASTRSYSFVFSIPSANTWTKIAVTIPGDTAGAWAISGNVASIVVQFDLGSGATYRTAAGAWTAGYFVGATGAVSVVATNAATYQLTGVKLEIGSVATPYNRQSLAKSMADCQRYYAVLGPTISGSNASGAGWQNWMHHTLPTTMRAAPTVAFAGTTYNNANNLTASQLSASSASTILSAAAAGGYWANYQILATAEL